MKWVWLGIATVSFVLLCVASSMGRDTALWFLVVEWLGIVMYVHEKNKTVEERSE